MWRDTDLILWRAKNFWEGKFVFDVYFSAPFSALIFATLSVHIVSRHLVIPSGFSSSVCSCMYIKYIHAHISCVYEARKSLLNKEAICERPANTAQGCARKSGSFRNTVDECHDPSSLSPFSWSCWSSVGAESITNIKYFLAVRFNKGSLFWTMI